MIAKTVILKSRPKDAPGLAALANIPTGTPTIKIVNIPVQIHLAMLLDRRDIKNQKTNSIKTGTIILIKKNLSLSLFLKENTSLKLRKLKAICNAVAVSPSYSRGALAGFAVV